MVGEKRDLLPARIAHRENLMIYIGSCLDNRRLEPEFDKPSMGSMNVIDHEIKRGNTFVNLIFSHQYEMGTPAYLIDGNIGKPPSFLSCE